MNSMNLKVIGNKMWREKARFSCRGVEYFETKFNAEAMNKFARPIFGDRQHGIFKQIFNISICECGDKDTAKSSYLDLDIN